MSTAVATLRDYFDARVDRDAEGCWIWQGSIMGTGYGQVRFQRRTLYAHRVSFELHHGPIGPGQVVCHRCDTPACVNPAHLFVGTQADNVHDMLAKGRHRHTPCLGTDHGMARLTEDQVLEIRRRAATGENQKDIAADFGTTATNVSMIHRRSTWRHL